MSYSEYMLNEVFGLFKKKKKETPKTSNRKVQSYPITDDDAKEIEKAIKTVVKKYNSDSNIKLKIKEAIDGYFEGIEEDKPKKIEKFTVDEFERYDTEISYIILDDEQYVRIALSGIIHDIGEEAKSMLPKGKYQFTYGDGDEGCVYIMKLKEDKQESTNESADIESRIRAIDSRVKSLEKTNDSYMASHGEPNEGIYNKIQDLMDERDRLRASIKESAEDLEYMNEVFGLSKKEREDKATEKKSLSDLEFAYDKKFNGFCLSVSGYSVEKLEAMLDKKQSELEEAKLEKKEASERYDKLAAQVKIDYLNNVCDRCKAMIKKKNSYK